MQIIISLFLTTIVLVIWAKQTRIRKAYSGAEYKSSRPGRA